MKKFALAFILATLLFSLQSCSCNENFDLDQDFLIIFKLFDQKSGQNLLELTSKYHKDSVKIFNESTDLIYPGPVPGSGSVAFHPYGLNASKIQVNVDTLSYFYLYLRDREVDIDTFKLEYKAHIGSCNEKKFIYLKLYFNEKIIFEDQGNPYHIVPIDLHK